MTTSKPQEKRRGTDGTDDVPTATGVEAVTAPSKHTQLESREILFICSNLILSFSCGSMEERRIPHLLKLFVQLFFVLVERLWLIST